MSFKNYIFLLLLTLFFVFQAEGQSPSGVSGLQLWLRSDTGVILNGANVTDWNDQSGNSYSSGQTNIAAQPQLISGVLNNKPALRFTGDKILNGSLIPGLSSSSLTIFVVASGAPMTEPYNVLFDIGAFAPGGLWFAKNNQNFTIYSNNAIYASTGGLANSGFSPSILGFRKQINTLAESFINTDSVASSTSAPFSGPFVNGNYNIGGDASYPGLWHGDVFEIILFNKALSSTELTVINDYLINKYAPPINLGTDTTACSFPFTLNAKKDYLTNYLWQDNSISDTLIINAPGTYYLTTTNIFGIQNSDTITVFQDTNTFYNVNLGADTIICSNQQILLNAGPNQYTYNWNTGSTASGILVNATGTYGVSTLNCFGNVSTDSIQVTVNPLPQFELGNDTITCHNNNFILDPGIQNSTLLNFLWNDNSPDSIHPVDHSGSYALQISDSIGCSFSDTINIVVDSSLYTLTLGSDTAFCDPQIITPIQGGLPNLAYLWNDNSTNDSLLIITSGQYSLSVTNLNNCVAKDTINVVINPIPVFSLGNDTSICFNSVYQIDPNIPSSTHTFSWSDASTDSVLTPTYSGSYWLHVTSNTNCVYDDSINIAIDSSLVNASLGADTSLCAGNRIFLISGNQAGLNYLWNDNTTDSTLTIINSGQYSVSLINVNNCIAADTINVNVSGQAPVAAFENSHACSNGLVMFNDTSIALSGNTITGWFWNFGDPNSTADTAITVQANYTFADTGSYTISLTVTTNAGCSQNITKNITVYPSASVSLGNDTSLCAGNQITAASTSGAGLTYLWNDNSVNDSLTINNSGQYYVTVTNTSNCSASDTANIIILGQIPVPDFSSSVGCLNNAVAFTDNSTPPAGNTISNWNWNFGNTLTLADTSLLQNSFYTYADTGFYNVSLTIVTNVGCKQTLIKSIHISPKPTVNFSTSIACKNDSVLFTNSASSPNYTPLSYQWNFSDVGSGINNTSVLPNPYHVFPLQLIYPVKLIVTNSAGCKDSITKNINVKAEVSADFTFTIPCTNSVVTFQDNSIAPLPNNQNMRTWTIGANTYNGLIVNHSFPVAGTYPVTLVVQGSNGCVSSITKDIISNLPPVTQFTTTTLCVLDTLKPLDQSIAQTGIITNWNWKLDSVTFSTTQAPQYIISSAGNYSIQLTVTNTGGCKDSLSKTLTVLPVPSAAFTTNPATTYITGSPVDFSPVNVNGQSYVWNIDNTVSSLQNLTYTFNSPGNHIASLQVSDTNGCSNSSTKNIFVRDYSLDLGILDVRTSVGSDDSVSIEVDLANFGTVPISAYDLNCYIINEGTIQESGSNLSGSGSYFTYVFSSKIKLTKNKKEYITCVNINSVNTIQDADQSNNSMCISSGTDHTSVSDPYPNPAKDNITIPVILKQEADISIDVIDLLSQTLIKTSTIKGSQGLNLISIPLDQINHGQYLLKIMAGDKLFVKKITRIN